ncbi:hypothetical protein ACFR99_09875 [Haloarchaeobius amylolyticus]|uniref:Uncharacterized protein n=1 Tax=Haloarchaeobius amylolyticus TaxID=1198296 RepID=A0ABD6BFM4_9EURY
MPGARTPRGVLDGRVHGHYTTSDTIVSTVPTDDRRGLTSQSPLVSAPLEDTADEVIEAVLLGRSRVTETTERIDIGIPDLRCDSDLGTSLDGNDLLFNGVMNHTLA